MFCVALSSGTSPTTRGEGDRVPELLAALEAVPARHRPQRTRSREMVAATPRAAHALDLVRIALESGGWAVGLGIGDLEVPPGNDLRAARGGAVEAAFEAMSRSSRAGASPVSVRAADPRHAETARDAEAVLGLVAWMIRRRSTGQWRAVRALREDPSATQAQLAERLGITQQTVSRSLRTSGWHEESAAHPLVERLLAMIDLTS